MGAIINNINENDLLALAADKLKQMTGIAYTIKPGNNAIDAYLIIGFPGDPKTEFAVEIKRNPAMVVAHEMAAMANPHLLATYYVNPRLAERLKNLGVPYIDCAGNAYINTKAIFVYVKGNKPEKKENIQLARLFKPGGLQVLFVLLCNPDFIKAPYRELAIKAGVALGTVAWAMKEMQKQGFIIDIGNNVYRLVKRETLLRLWLIGYEQALRPRQLVKRYHAEKHDWWMNAKPGRALWGGEVAAYKMTGYLKPETVTLYAAKLTDPLIFENRLRPDPNGEIELVEPFWNFEYPEIKENLAPPLCVYADLMIRADGRTTETAKMIYEKYIDRYINKN
jgi:hypothetical protein